MIAIRLQNEWLDLDERTALRFELHAPLFDTDVIRGEYSFPFSFPASPKNRKLFGFADEPAAEADWSERNCQIYVKGNFWKSAMISLTGSSRTRYSANLRMGSSFLAVQLKETLLADLDLGGDRAIGPTMQDVIDHANSTTDGIGDYVFFPILNADFYGEDRNATYGGTVNDWDPVAQTFIDNTFGANRNCLCPQVFVSYLIERIGLHFDYHIEGEILDDIDFKKLTIYNNYALDSQFETLLRASLSTTQSVTAAQQSPTGKVWIAFDDDSTAPNQDEYNNFDTGTHEYDLNDHGLYAPTVQLTIDNYSIPAGGADFFVAIYLDGVHYGTGKLITPLGAGPVSVILDDVPQIYRGPSDPAQLLTAGVFMKETGTSNYLDFDITASSIEIEHIREFNRFSRTINLQNHVPRVSVATLLSELRKSFDLVFDWNHQYRKLTILKSQGILDSSVRKALPVPFNPNYTIEHRKQSFRIENAYPSDDQLEKLDSYTNQFGFIEVGSDKANPNKIHLNAVPLPEESVEFEDGNFLSPIIQQEGSSDLFELGSNNNESIRFCFYHGLQPDNTTNAYLRPFASHHNYSADGTRISELTLKLTGDDGLYEQFFEDRFEMMADQQLVSFSNPFQLIGADQFDLVDKFLDRGVEYLVAKASLVVGRSGVVMGLELSKLLK